MGGRTDHHPGRAQAPRKGLTSRPSTRRGPEVLDHDVVGVATTSWDLRRYLWPPAEVPQPPARAPAADVMIPAGRPAEAMGVGHHLPQGPGRGLQVVGAGGVGGSQKAMHVERARHHRARDADQQPLADRAGAPRALRRARSPTSRRCPTASRRPSPADRGAWERVCTRKGPEREPSCCVAPCPRSRPSPDSGPALSAPWARLLPPSETGPPAREGLPPQPLCGAGPGLTCACRRRVGPRPPAGAHTGLGRPAAPEGAAGRSILLISHSEPRHEWFEEMGRKFPATRAGRALPAALARVAG